MKKLQIYKNLKVIVTGSTGFKGSWLCFWLSTLNAKVVGIAFRPEKGSVIYKKLGLEKKIRQIYLDIKSEVCIKNLPVNYNFDTLYSEFVY